MKPLLERFSNPFDQNYVNNNIVNLHLDFNNRQMARSSAPGHEQLFGFYFTVSLAFPDQTVPASLYTLQL